MFTKSPQIDFDALRQTVLSNTRETVIEAFDTHWVKYVVPVIAWISVLAVSIGLLSIAGSSIHSAQLWQKATFMGAVLLLTVVHHWFFHRMLSESMQDVIITNRRFMYLESTLWSTDEMREIALRQIKGVDAQKRGLLQNIFRYGQIAIDTGGTDMRDRTFGLIPHPDRKARLLTSLVRLLVDQRNL